MTKRDSWISLFIIASVVIVSSRWLMQEYEVSNDSISGTGVVQKKNASGQAVAIGETHNEAISEEKDSIQIPKFVLTATVVNVQKSKALMVVNKKEPQWFHIGENVIDNYSVHDISNSLVTLFDGSGAYYEISLFDTQLEDEPPVEVLQY